MKELEYFQDYLSRVVDIVQKARQGEAVEGRAREDDRGSRGFPIMPAAARC